MNLAASFVLTTADLLRINLFVFVQKATVGGFRIVVKIAQSARLFLFFHSLSVSSSPIAKSFLHNFFALFWCCCLKMVKAANCLKLQLYLCTFALTSTRTHTKKTRKTREKLATREKITKNWFFAPKSLWYFHFFFMEMIIWYASQWIKLVRKITVYGNIYEKLLFHNLHWFELKACHYIIAYLSRVASIYWFFY